MWPLSRHRRPVGGAQIRRDDSRSSCRSTHIERYIPAGFRSLPFFVGVSESNGAQIGLIGFVHYLPKRNRRNFLPEAEKRIYLHLQRFPVSAGNADGELKGNAVKIGDSSRCCNPHAPFVVRERRGTLCHWLRGAGKAPPTEGSQKTCRCDRGLSI